MQFSVTKQKQSPNLTATDGTSVAASETTTVDVPFEHIVRYLAGAAAVVTALITLIGKGGDLIAAFKKPPIVLTAENAKTYQAILSIRDQKQRYNTLKFFIENNIVPGDLGRLKEAEIPLWPSATNYADNSAGASNSGDAAPAGAPAVKAGTTPAAQNRATPPTPMSAPGK